MKNVEQGIQESAVRRLPMWIFVGALACLGVGALLTQRVHAPREHANVEPQPASTDQSLEIDRLKKAVTLLEHKSAALAVAVSSPQRDASLRPKDDETPKPPPEVRAPRTAVDEITALEDRFASEQDGSRDSQLVARTIHAELSAAPLRGARITGVACSSSLCRATLEQDANADALDMTALIDATPTVRRESMFDYSQEGSIKRVTIYSAREGHQLNP